MNDKKVAYHHIEGYRLGSVGGNDFNGAATPNPMIATGVGIEAAQKVGELVAQEEIEWALAGSLAMHLYGSPRLTKYVDIITLQDLSLTAKHQLSFGGGSYSLQSVNTKSRLVGLCAAMAIRSITLRR